MLGTLLFVAVFVFPVWFIVSLPKRVEKKIIVDGKKRGYEILFIRDVCSYDGALPFKMRTFNWSNTKIFGIYNDFWISYKVVTVKRIEDEAMYWVKAEPSGFLFIKTEWKRYKKHPLYIP